MNLLNPVLFNRLRSKFGDVSVYRSGEVGQWMKRQGLTKIVDWGECYAVNCPFCGDQKKHLWISYLWGSVLNGKPVYPAVCYRRHCLSHPVHWKHLFIALKYHTPHLIRTQVARVTKIELSPIPLPAGSIPINTLPDDHPAVIYLQQRGFDPTWVYTHFKVHAIEWTHPMLSGRIVIPTILNGQIVGWQARTYVNDPCKYLSAPGVKIHATVYNKDAADDADIIILVEGMIDAWRICQSDVAVGAALCGKNMSLSQAEIVSGWIKQGKIVGLCLDADAQAEQKKICQQIEGVQPIWLNEGDPDENLETVLEQLCRILESIRASRRRDDPSVCESNHRALRSTESILAK